MGYQNLKQTHLQFYRTLTGSGTANPMFSPFNILKKKLPTCLLLNLVMYGLYKALLYKNNWLLTAM